MKAIHNFGVDTPIGYDGEKFSWETGYDSTLAKLFWFTTERTAVYLKRGSENTFEILTGETEEALDCTEIYPKRVGTIAAVYTKQGTDNTTRYFFTDTTPATVPAYTKLPNGPNLTVVFQDGNLAGREFEVIYRNSAYGSGNDAIPAKSFEIIAKEEDGYDMPNGTFIPAAGDKYVVFNCSLPASYVGDNTTHTGAEWEVAKKVIEYMYEKSDVQYAIDLEIDGIWARSNWSRLSLGSFFRIGAYIKYSDADMFSSGILLRVVRVKTKLNYPYAPEIELSHIHSRYGLRKRQLLQEANLQASLSGTINVQNKLESQINRIEYQLSQILSDIAALQQQAQNSGGSNT